MTINYGVNAFCGRLFDNIRDAEIARDDDYNMYISKGYKCEKFTKSYAKFGHDIKVYSIRIFNR